MTATPDIQVSRDQKVWFSIFNFAEMQLFSGIMTNITIDGRIPMFYLRVAPDHGKQQYTPIATFNIGMNPPKPQGGQ